MQIDDLTFLYIVLDALTRILYLSFNLSQPLMYIEAILAVDLGYILRRYWPWVERVLILCAKLDAVGLILGYSRFEPLL